MNRTIVLTLLASFVICAIVIGVINRKDKSALKKSGTEQLFQKALSLESHSRLEEAAGAYQELIKQFPQHELAASAWYKLGEIYERAASRPKAKEAYTRIIAEFPNFKQISEVEKKLWDVNIKLLFSPVISKGDIVYKVEPQDTLTKIAAKYNTTVELIMRSNDLKSDLIRPDQQLKISPAKYSVIIDKSQNLLTLKADEEIFKVYPVATGTYNCTPVGSFKIVEKLESPDWYKKGEGIVPAASPENILGTRWLGLSEPQYGIHGGAQEEDLGRQVTNGCVRMLDADVEELFSILPRGAEVIIVD